MTKGIRVSKKWGVNPTIPVCFWCGEEKDEIALLGKLKGDIEAPHRMWIPGDYEPCDSCKSKFEKGIVLIEADTKPIINENQPPYYGAYPTGHYMVIKEEAFKKIFNEDIYEQASKNKMCFIDKETAEQLMKLNTNANEKEN